MLLFRRLFFRCLAIGALVAGMAGCALPAGNADHALGAPPLPQASGPLAQIPTPADCHPAPSAAAAQYVIGYGSLMQDESRKRTAPNAGPAHPVEVSGFRRGWFAQGAATGFSTTFLGVVPDRSKRLNAVAYRIEAAELQATDLREASYCRWKVPASDLKSLDPAASQAIDGESWIYVNTPDAIGLPTPRVPIVQSYVDIFVSGCLEQEERFKLPGFARNCVATTQDWSPHWVNDRLYPRRPFIYQPRSGQIDKLLSQQLPDIFSRIRVE
jgi:hypothetical protein